MTKEELLVAEIAQLHEQIKQIQETCRRLTEKLKQYEPEFTTTSLYTPKVTKL